MGSLTYLLIISVVSYLIYYTYKEVTRPLSSSLKDDIKKINDKIKKDNNGKKWNDKRNYMATKRTRY